MGGGGLRVVERNGRVAGVLWCVFHVFQWSGRPGPEREDQDAAGGAKGETGVCSSMLCSVPYRKSEVVPSCRVPNPIMSC